MGSPGQHTIRQQQVFDQRQTNKSRQCISWLCFGFSQSLSLSLFFLITEYKQLTNAGATFSLTVPPPKRRRLSSCVWSNFLSPLGSFSRRRGPSSSIATAFRLRKTLRREDETDRLLARLPPVHHLLERTQ